MGVVKFLTPAGVVSVSLGALLLVAVFVSVTVRIVNH